MPFSLLTRWLRDADRRPAKRPSLLVDRLEDRWNPAASLVDQSFLLPSAGNQPSELIAASTDGRYVLFQSKATDLIVNQQDLPDTNDLFWKDLLTGQIKMVTALPPVGPNGTYDYAQTQDTPQSFSLQAVLDQTIRPSFSQAVLSADGKFVAFSSVINAGRLDDEYDSQLFNPTEPNKLGTDLNNTLDVFRWSSTSGEIRLASRGVPAANTFNRPFALGLVGPSTNPAISADGTVVGFVSTVDAYFTSDLGRPSKFDDDIIIDANSTPDVFVTSFDPNITGQRVRVVSARTSTAAPPDPSTEEFRYTRTLGHAGGAGLSVDPLGRYLSVDASGNINVVFTAPVDPSVAINAFMLNESTKIGTVPYYKFDVNASGFRFINPPELSGSVGTFQTKNNKNEAWQARIDTGLATDVNIRLITSTDGTNDSKSGLTPRGGNADNIIISVLNADAMIVSTSVANAIADGLYRSTQSANVDEPNLYFVRSDTTPLQVNRLNTNRPPSLSTNPVRNDPVQYTITPDGKYIGYVQIDNPGAVVPNTTRGMQVYLAQALPSFTKGVVVSLDINGKPASEGANFPRISRNGRYITFSSDTPSNQMVAPGLTDFNNLNADITRHRDVFLRDLFATDPVTGAITPRNLLLSINAAGTGTGNGPSDRGFVGTNLDIPSDGIAPTDKLDSIGRAYFQSSATNIDAGFPPTHGGTSVYTQSLPVGGIPPAFPTKASREAVVSGGRQAGVQRITFTGDGNVVNGTRLTPYPGFAGEIRVALADVNGDGVLDTIVAPGPGAGPRVIVFNGVNDARLFDFFVYEPNFRGGVNIAAADINGDGKAELITGADRGGGARVRVLDLANSKTLADFFAYDVNFRGGVRVATGDLNNDGRPDVITGAGAGGGPRVSAFSGASIAATGALVRFVDFFAMEINLRNGVYVAAGDMNSDGIDDIVVGAGAGGGPRVAVFESQSVIARPGSPDLIFNFFAGNTNDRSGVRVAVKNVDGDAVSDIVTGAGNGRESRIRTFAGGRLAATLTPAEINNTFVVFDDVNSSNGAWVG